MYQTLIQNARVLDGSGSSARHVDVAISDNGKLSLFPPGNGPAAGETIDAGGLCLAPGFIDVHTHDDTAVIKNPEMENKISQGVTTVIVGNCGISASPVSLNRDEPPNPMNLLGEVEDFRYPKFSDYVDAVQKARPSVNVAALIGHTSLRSNHLEDLFRPANPDEIEAMRNDLRESLKDGAIGLSSGLAYDTAYEAPDTEVKALIEEVAESGGVYTTHMRTEFDEIIDAINESFDIAKHGRVPLIISHLKCAGAANWGRSSEVLKHVEKQSETHKFACDCYPYSASSSNLDPKQVTDKNDIFITWSRPHPDQSGRLLAEIAEEWDLSLLDTAYKLMPAGAVYHCMSEKDMQNILRYERTMIGSDGLPEDPFPHPRLWGTFPRVLGRYCRDLNLFDLPAAIHKMSGLSATEFGLKERGFIADGYKADLVLFDSKKVRDVATYENPKQHSEGIKKVWVNGQLSYSSGEKTNGRAGECILRK
ncbi:MAG: D-aminoacylase [Balneolaceae bacterium]|nr:D-aminoacylase [Balneolaceae bacterium]